MGHKCRRHRRHPSSCLRNRTRARDTGNRRWSPRQGGSCMPRHPGSRLSGQSRRSSTRRRKQPRARRLCSSNRRTTQPRCSCRTQGPCPWRPDAMPARTFVLRACHRWPRWWDRRRTGSGPRTSIHPPPREWPTPRTAPPQKRQPVRQVQPKEGHRR